MKAELVRYGDIRANSPFYLLNPLKHKNAVVRYAGVLSDDVIPADR